MPPPQQYARKSNDESFIITAVVGGLFAFIVLGYLLNWYLQAQSTRAMNRAKTEAYQQYLRNTPVKLPTPQSEATTKRLAIREQLLAHPAVKPEAGFAAPGVQSTGKIIVDALDKAQGRNIPPP